MSVLQCCVLTLAVVLCALTDQLLGATMDSLLYKPRVVELSPRCVTVSWDPLAFVEARNSTLLGYRAKYQLIEKNTKPKLRETSSSPTRDEDEERERDAADIISRPKRAKSDAGGNNNNDGKRRRNKKKKSKKKKNKNKNRNDASAAAAAGGKRRRVGWTMDDECSGGAEINSCHVCNLTADHKYKFRVEAHYQTGMRVQSESSTSLVVGLPPEQPYITAITPVDHETLEITWQLNVGHRMPPHGFTIHHREYGSSGDYVTTRVEGADGRRRELASLAPLTDYEVYVAAYSANGESSPSNPRYGQTTVGLLPESDEAIGSSTEESTRLLIIILGTVLGGLILLLLIFIVLCAWKQRQQRQIIMVMDEKIRSKYADTSLQTYMERAVSKTNGPFPNGQLQQQSGGGGGSALTQPNPMFQLSSYVHAMRYAQEPHDAAEAERLHQNGFRVATVAPGDSFYSAADRSNGGGGDVGMQYNVEEEEEEMEEEMEEEGDNGRPPTPPPPIDRDTWERLQKSHYRAPHQPADGGVIVDGAPYNILPQTQQRPYLSSFASPADMAAAPPSPDDEQTPADADDDDGDCAFSFPPPPPVHATEEEGEQEEEEGEGEEVSYADSQPSTLASDRLSPGSTTEQTTSLPRSLGSPDRAASAAARSQGAPPSPAGSGEPTGVRSPEGRQRGSPRSSPYTSSERARRGEAGVVQGSPYGSPYSSKHGSREKHRRRRKRSKNKDSASLKGHNTDQETVCSVKSGHHTRDSRPSEGDCSSDA